MKYYKISLLEYLLNDDCKGRSDWVYDEKYGFYQYCFRWKCLFFSNNQFVRDINVNELYKVNKNGNHNRLDLSLYDFLKKERWSKNDYYFSTMGTQIRIEKIQLEISIIDFFSVPQNMVYSFVNEEECNQKEVLIFNDFEKEDLIIPDIKDIQVGNEYFMPRNGNIIVSEVYQYPNKSDKLFKAKTLDNNMVDICYGTEFYYFPYVDVKDPFDELDENLNELFLQPILSKRNITYTICWLKVEDAFEYVVSIYRIVRYQGRKTLYHLKDQIVDRNDNYFIINGLAGEGYRFKVSAINRDRKKIALSRSISEDLPSYYNTRKIKRENQ